MIIINLVPRVGFTLNGNTTDDHFELMEGSSSELCVSLLGLSTSEVFIQATVSLTPDSPKGENASQILTLCLL